MLARTIPLLATATLLAACSRDRSPTPAVTMAIFASLEGTTEPCGCTSKPLGGLDRLAGELERRRQQNPMGLLVVGNTFVEHADPPGYLFEQERAKADAIARVLARLHPSAIVVGPKDVGVQWPYLQGLARREQLPVLRQPKNTTTVDRADHLILHLGGHRIGVVGMPGDPAGDVAAYDARAARLRTDGAEVVIALLPMPAARPFAQQLRHVDIAVAAGDDTASAAAMVGSTVYVQSGDKGRYLGLLTLHFTGDGRWALERDVRAEQEATRARIQRLHRELEGLPNGPARHAREAKLQDLQRQLASAPPAAASGRRVAFAAHAIETTTQPAPWASDILTQYNRSLCVISKEATASRACAPAPSPADVYVGTPRCVGCHAAPAAVHGATAHAHAWKTLQDAGKDCDVTCIGCHSVGFERPGGYCRLQDAQAFANVGCESCHGPGQGHAGNPGDRRAWGDGFVATPTEATCVTCHNPEHSDTFDFARYLPQVLGPGHGKPL